MLSFVVHVMCSVPQGSVLGPLFFNLYMADLADRTAKFGASLHAYGVFRQQFSLREATKKHRGGGQLGEKFNRQENEKHTCRILRLIRRQHWLRRRRRRRRRLGQLASLNDVTREPEAARQRGDVIVVVVVSGGGGGRDGGADAAVAERRQAVGGRLAAGRRECDAVVATQRRRAAAEQTQRRRRTRTCPSISQSINGRVFNTLAWINRSLSWIAWTGFLS